MHDILLIEDEESRGDFLYKELQKDHPDIVATDDLDLALYLLKNKAFKVALLEGSFNPEKIHLPMIKRKSDKKNFCFFNVVLKHYPPSRGKTIVITYDGVPDEAEYAIKNGAYDYIDLSPLLGRVELIFDYNEQTGEKSTPRLPVEIDGFQPSPDHKTFKHLKNRISIALKTSKQNIIKHELNSHNIIGTSPPIIACLKEIGQVSQTDQNVLILGETGTGKELTALAIHYNSLRKAHPLVSLNCAAITESVAEAELFGTKKKVITGVSDTTTGKIEAAHRGTLFLDEVGDLPYSIQKKLLRVIQEKQFLKVGGTEPIKSDFRVISATHRDLPDLVKKNQFREDLLYRINAFSIEVPTLRDRKEDIKQLIDHFVQTLCLSYGIDSKTISEDFYEALKHQEWKGNIRELKNIIQYAITKSFTENVLLTDHLPQTIFIDWRRSPFERRASGKYTMDEVAADMEADKYENDQEITDTDESSLELESIFMRDPNLKKTIGPIAVGNHNIEIDLDLDTQDLPAPLANKQSEKVQKEDTPSPWKEFSYKMHKDYLKKLIKYTSGNVTEAAKIYGVSNSQFYNVLRNHKISIKKVF
jgi:two-component system, NtrC family, response regulator